MKRRRFLAAGMAGPRHQGGFCWRLEANGWPSMEYRYHRTGNHDHLGVNLDYPESHVRAVTWLGDGPYQVYKNRTRGVTPDVWTKAHNNSATGASAWQYPEFNGHYANTCWAALSTTEGAITMVAAQEPLFLLFTPAVGVDPVKRHRAVPGGRHLVPRRNPRDGQQVPHRDATGPRKPAGRCRRRLPLQRLPPVQRMTPDAAIDRSSIC